jgi:hypothetical protein
MKPDLLRPSELEALKNPAVMVYAVALNLAACEVADGPDEVGGLIQDCLDRSRAYLRSNDGAEYRNLKLLEVLSILCGETHEPD